MKIFMGMRRSALLTACTESTAFGDWGRARNEPALPDVTRFDAARHAAHAALGNAWGPNVNAPEHCCPRLAARRGLLPDRPERPMRSSLGAFFIMR